MSRGGPGRGPLLDAVAARPYQGKSISATARVQ